MLLEFALTSTILVYVLLLLYMRSGWSKIPFHKVQTSFVARQKVSIIVAARNEEENIGRLLDCLVAQVYPKELLEIIVVDDHSIDGTADIVCQYKGQGVQLIQLNESQAFNSYKKFAISKAIEKSTGEIIVTTDADCRMGEHWLQTILSSFDDNQWYMLSSPVQYSEEKTFFERLQTLEFLYLIGLGAAGIGNKKPTTCNGANLAYRKDVFLEMGGFNGIDDLASGDDELLLHKIAEKYADRIGFCKSKEAIVYTDAKPSVGSFYQQRKRWASKSTKYKDKKVVTLGVSIWLFNLLLVITFALGLVKGGTYWSSFVAVFLVKCLFEWLFLLPLTKFANLRPYLKYLPIISFLHPFYLVTVGIMGNIGKYNWKDRAVK